MAKAEKTKKNAKKEKPAPKAAQNSPKTREFLTEKKEPSSAAQMMKAYGKSKLVKELQEHRVEQKTEERRSEQAQAVDTLSEEAEVTAGAAIEEGTGLLASDLQHLQEWRPVEPPPLSPLEEVPPAPEPVYPISAPKSDTPRKLPTRQVSRLPSSTPSAAKTKPARSIPTERAAPPTKKPASPVQVSKLMQEHGRLLFRRKRMQAQRVKLQQHPETAYFAQKSAVSREIYPLAERSSVPTKLPDRYVSQIPVSREYAPRTPDYGRTNASSQKPAPISAQDKRRLIMQKRQKTQNHATNPTLSMHFSDSQSELFASESSPAYPAELVRMQKAPARSTEPAGMPHPPAHPVKSAGMPHPSAHLMKPSEILQSPEFSGFVEQAGERVQPVIEPSRSMKMRVPTVQERRKLVLKKRMDAHRYTIKPSPKSGFSRSEFAENRAENPKPLQMRPLTVQERRKMVTSKRQKPKTASEPEFPLAPVRQKVGTAADDLPRSLNFPAASFSQTPVSVNPSVVQSAVLQTEIRGQPFATNRTFGNARKLLPSGWTAQSKSFRVQEKLLQSKRKLLQPKQKARLPKHGHVSAKAAYQRAFHIRQTRKDKKIIQRGLAAIANSLKRLVKVGISIAKNAGAGAFACIILLSLVLTVGMAGALAGSSFGVLFSPQRLPQKRSRSAQPWPKRIMSISGKSLISSTTRSMTNW